MLRASSRYNLSSCIIASLLIILYIITFGPLKDALAFVMPHYITSSSPVTLTITVDSEQWTVNREYDSLDRLTKLTYPDGEKLTYTYNPQGIEQVKGLSPEAIRGRTISQTPPCPRFHPWPVPLE
jgi:hypothetical protein